MSEEFTTEQLSVEQQTKIDRTQVTQTIEASKTTPVLLPEGAQIVAILANGNDLFIRLSDGSLIQITNGLITIPTIITSGGEITSETLTAALQANGVVLPAAGQEQGTDSNDSSGNNFGPPGPFTVEAFDPNPLLPPTQFDRAFGGFIETGGFIINQPPVVGDPITIRVSEEGLPDGNPDNQGNIDTTNDAQVLNVPLPVSDPDGDPLTIVFTAEPTLPSGPLSSGGTEIVWTGVGTNQLVGTAGPSGPVIMTVTINPDNTIDVVLEGKVDHPFAGSNPAQEDELQATFPISVSDGVNPQIGTEVVVIIEDDLPTLNLGTVENAANQLEMELDETIGSDRYNTTVGETGEETGTNTNTDDDTVVPIDEYLARVSTNVSGGLTTLFTNTGTFGADGGSDSGELSFVGLPTTPNSYVATTMSATDGGTIYLEYVSDTQFNGVDANDGTGDVVFTVEIVGAPGAEQIQTTLFEAVDHDDDGNKFDTQLDLLLAGGESPIQLQYEVTRTDGDTDFVKASNTINLISDSDTVIAIDDDGPDSFTVAPVENAANQLEMELDETIGADRYNTTVGETGEETGTNTNTDDDTVVPIDEYLARVSTNVSGGLTTLFTVSPNSADYGQDLPGSDSGELSFVGLPTTPDSYVATTMSATDGGTIYLEYVSDTQFNGVDANDGTGDVVFTVEIVGAPGAEQIQTTLFEAVDHDDDGNKFDTQLDLLLAGGESPIQLQYEVTRTDGDTDFVKASNTINLISDSDTVIAIDDDGPDSFTVAPVENAANQLEMELDETIGADRYNTTVGETGEETGTNTNTDDDTVVPIDEYLARVSTNVSGGLTTLFTVSPNSADYGQDLPGSDSGELSFVGLPTTPNSYVATTMSATDGGTIYLEYVSDTQFNGVDANDGTGDVVFTVEIVGAPGAEQIQTTLFEAVDHDDDGNKFDTQLDLLLAGGESPIQLQYEVTRTDGDTDFVKASNTINLISDSDTVIAIDDDGPDSFTVAPVENAANQLEMELDETIGADRYNTTVGETGEETGTNTNTDDDTVVPIDEYLARVSTNVSGGLTTLFTVSPNSADYGQDLPGSDSGELSFVGLPTTPNSYVATTMSATDGGTIYLEYVSDTQFNGVDANDGTGDVVFTVEIVGAPGAEQIQTTLFEAVDHDDDGNKFDTQLDLLLAGGESPIQLQYEVTRTDGDTDFVKASNTINLISDSDTVIAIDDDGPDSFTVAPVENAANQLEMELDETIGADRYNTTVGETGEETGTNTNTDDDTVVPIDEYLARVSTNVSGGLTTLFTVSPNSADYGQDLPGSDSGELSFVGLPTTPNSYVATTMSATDGGTIYLEYVSDTQFNGVDANDGTGDVVFTVEIVGAPGAEQIQTTLFEAVDHDDDGNKFDTQLDLLLAGGESPIQLQYEVTRTDGDTDFVKASNTINLISDSDTVIAIDDDGPDSFTVAPVENAANQLEMELDETIGADRYNTTVGETGEETGTNTNTDDDTVVPIDEYLARVSTNVSGGLTTLFTVSPNSADYGQDLPGSDSGELSFVGLPTTPDSYVATTMSATDGGTIYLEYVSDTQFNGVDANDGTGDVVFTVEIVGAPGAEQIQTTLFEAVDHDDDGNKFDTQLDLLLAGGESPIQLQYEVTRTDGDTDFVKASNTINLISDSDTVIAIDDDGPDSFTVAPVENAANQLEMELDETIGADRYNTTVGETGEETGTNTNTDDDTVVPIDEYLARVSTNVSGGLTTLFTVSPNSADYGQDLPGSDSGELSFVGLPTTPNSYVATTMSATDGGTIYLEYVSDTQFNGVDANDGTGDVVFTVEIVGAPGAEQIQTTLFEAVDHDDDGNKFDTQLDLLLAGGESPIQLQYEVTRTDGDTDFVKASNTINLISDSDTVIAIDDDGPDSFTVAPVENAANQLEMELDETIGADRYNTTVGETGEETGTNTNTDDDTVVPIDEYLARVSTNVSGGLTTLFTVSPNSADYGQDLPGSDSGELSFVGLPTTPNSYVATTMSATDGGTIYLEYVSDTQFNGVDANDGTGDVVFTVEIVGAPGAEQIQTTLFEAVDHDDDGNKFDTQLDLLLAGGESPIQLQYEVTRTDGDTDFVKASNTINLISDSDTVIAIDDDGPDSFTVAPVENAANQLEMELDETIGADRYNTTVGETGEETGTNTNTDDDTVVPIDEYLARVSTNVSGGLTTLFTVSPNSADYGQDLPGSDSGELSFVGLPTTPNSYVATTMSATDGGTIYLEYVSDTQFNGVDANDGTGDVVFTVEIVGAPGAEQIQTTLFEAVDHDDDGNKFDTQLDLLLAGGESPIQLQYEVTRTDGDTDFVKASNTINLISDSDTVIAIDDDGPDSFTVAPVENAANQLEMELDETIGADRYNTTVGETGEETGTNTNTDDDTVVPIDEYLARVSTNVSGGLTTLFTVSPNSADYGQDLPGSDSGELSFVGLPTTPDSYVATTMSATDGGTIYLEYVSDTQFDGSLPITAPAMLYSPSRSSAHPAPSRSRRRYSKLSTTTTTATSSIPSSTCCWPEAKARSSCSTKSPAPMAIQTSSRHPIPST